MCMQCTQRDSFIVHNSTWFTILDNCLLYETLNLPIVGYISAKLTLQSSSHFLLTSVGLLLATPGYSEPNSMQDLRLIDQYALNRRLQGVMDDRTNFEEKSEEEEDYEEIIRMNVDQTEESPPPLPPRQLK